MSDNSNTTTKSGGIGFVGILTILFIALKLTGHITWSWIWVLSPLWISFLVAVSIFIIAALFILWTKR
jgi:hypothetical protein